MSLVGFTPDVLVGPLMGVLLNNSPGVLGHQHVFASVAGFGAVGLIATIVFRRITHRPIAHWTRPRDRTIPKHVRPQR